MTTVASLLHAHGKKLALCFQSGCGDDQPEWRGAVHPPCATLFRNMPWVDLFTDMGTYPLTGGPPLTAADLALQECPPPANKLTRWCGLEGQVLNHLRPLPDLRPPEFGMAPGRYSVGLWPRSCINGTVAGQWTQETLHEFLVFLDSVGVRSLDVWCSGTADQGGPAMPCPAIAGLGACTWFTAELAWWKANGR